MDFSQIVEDPETLLPETLTLGIHNQRLDVTLVQLSTETLRAPRHQLPLFC